MKNPSVKGGFVVSAVCAVIIACLGLSGCGKEGPLGNTPEPKKPVWQHDLGRII